MRPTRNKMPPPGTPGTRTPGLGGITRTPMTGGVRTPARPTPIRTPKPRTKSESSTKVRQI